MRARSDKGTARIRVTGRRWRGWLTYPFGQAGHKCRSEPTMSVGFRNRMADYLCDNEGWPLVEQPEAAIPTESAVWKISFRRMSTAIPKPQLEWVPKKISEPARCSGVS
jgi:hypothetical protein